MTAGRYGFAATAIDRTTRGFAAARLLPRRSSGRAHQDKSGIAGMERIEE